MCIHEHIHPRKAAHVNSKQYAYDYRYIALYDNDLSDARKCV